MQLLTPETLSDSATNTDKPLQTDLDRCVHCGLCLNACPTYRELGLEMDSPRGRIYQMVQVSEGNIEINRDYINHIELCLACRACETACPSGVEYGRLIEAARAEIGTVKKLGWQSRLLRWFVYRHLLLKPFLLTLSGYGIYFYQSSGLQRLVRKLGILKPFRMLSELEQLTPPAEPPFFFEQIGNVFPAHGETKHRVALMAGCIANVSFSKLNGATVRVLQRNDCEVTVAAGQSCCGALHVHTGLRDLGRQQAKQNIMALEPGQFDAIITNAAGCGSVMKEYPDLFEHGSAWHTRARNFSSKVKDISEFLATIQLNRDLGPLQITVTYQDSCHLLHGQKVRTPPRQMLKAIPKLQLRELPLTELCCGSAGVYNIEHTEMSIKILEQKMRMIQTTGADTIATANPGCLLQLRAGVEMFGRGERVVHIAELLDESYRQSADNTYTESSLPTSKSISSQEP